MRWFSVTRGAILGLALAFVVAGCDGGSKSAVSSPAGQKVFVSAGCGGCHTLAAAKSRGQVGPNLDQLRPSYKTVVHQVRTGGNGMPSFASRLNSSQITDVATFVSKSADPHKSVVAAFKPDETKISSCHDAPCYQQAFGNVAYYDGPQKALAELDADSRSNSTIATNCHPIAHMIGHAGLARYHGNAAQALGNGSMTCASGYYHGVVEVALAGVPRSKVAAMARKMCVLKAKEFVVYQCVHGLGHGLMVYSRDDLPYSLHVCEQLQTAWFQTSCDGGVFMQNVVTTMGLRSKWLKKNDLIYPCDAVATRHKLYCYLLVSSRILPAVGYDWRKAADWCRRSEHGWAGVCFQSYGRDVSGTALRNPTEIRRLCAMAGSGEKECLYGAVRDILNTNGNDLGARRLCESVKRQFRAYCFFGIGTILGTLQPTAAEKRAACARFASGADFAECLKGAGA